MIKEKLFLVEDDADIQASTSTSNVGSTQYGFGSINPDDVKLGKNQTRNVKRVGNKLGNVSNKKADLDKADDYQKEYNDIHTSVEDQKKLATDFLDKRFKGQQNADLVKPLYPALIEEIDALGFENDFLNFVDRVVIKYGIQMTEDQYTVIHDSFANGYLDKDDLRGTTTDGANNIIFNKDLYKKDPKDMDFYIKCFNWFVPENREKITAARPMVNKVEVVIKDDYNDLRAFGDLKRLRNDLMFEGDDVKGKDPEKSLRPLRPVNQVKAEMNRFESTDRKVVQGKEKGENPGTDRTEDEGTGQRNVNATKQRTFKPGNEKHWKAVEDIITQANKGQPLNNGEWQDLVNYIIKTKGLK